MTGSEGARVRHSRYGEVWVDGLLVAPEVRDPWGAQEIVIRIRERTPDEWWRRAADLMAAMEEPMTGGPLGEGVDFLLEGAGDLVGADTRQAIQEDAYEEARATILAGVDSHLRKVAPVFGAVSRLSGEAS